MTAHLDRERLIALRHGWLSGEESRTALNHVATCAECQRAAREAMDLDTPARELTRSLDEEPRARRLPKRWLAIAAAIAAVVVAVPLLDRDDDVPVVTTTTTAPAIATTTTAAPGRPERWEAVVREAMAAGTLEMPAALAALQPRPDQFRASGGQVRVPEMRPFAEIVETTRPRFRWPAEEGASFTVLVGERSRIVTQSPPLRVNEWTCDVELPRGRAYTWQVEVRRGDATSMLPMPPAPPARFEVLSARTKEALDAVRRDWPDDHLLLGVLCARAGLREAALEELGAVPEGGALRRSVANWQR